MSEIIEVSVDGAVRTVTLNRPEKRNALNSEMLTALHAAFVGEPAAAERVAVIRATGPVFCAGLDLREREAGLPGGEVSIEQMLDRIQHWPLPVVAVVQGDAMPAATSWRCTATSSSPASRPSSGCPSRRSASRPHGSWPRSCSRSPDQWRRAKSCCWEIVFPLRECTTGA